MNWTLLVTKPARKGLEKSPNKDQIRIEQALDLLQSDPFSGDIKRLQPPGWRRRVGNYRILYDLFVAESALW
jgi:mRNA-degrading endonuclease RelE of RelBE toxin-antitoxin system